jgi:hypothetical protein
VSDGDLDAEPQFGLRRPIGQGGVGLLLVRTFAADSGWYRDHTKHVWAGLNHSSR